jgi:hypothetical protein
VKARQTPLTRPGETRSAASLGRPLWRWKSKESISESWEVDKSFTIHQDYSVMLLIKALCAQYGLRRGEGFLKPPRDPSRCMCESRCPVICTCKRLSIDL